MRTPVRRIRRQIEEASLNAWPALRQILYDGWILRFSEGYTKRANSVNSLYESRLGTEKKVRFAEKCYHDREMPAIFRITPFSTPHDLDPFLAQRGYVQLDPTRVMVLDLADSYAPACVVSPEVKGELRQEGLDEWLALFAHLRNEQLASQQIHGAILHSIAGEVQPHLLDVQGATAACALGVLEEDRLGLFDLFVDPAFRNQGCGTALTSHILHRAKQRRVRWVYLQVTEANEAAQGLYRRLGFRDLYGYWYRIR
ncbi:MAG TPA: GNAT family N-acetyltransferase [Anaerolineae bacterium]|nr:GNAT family N-acetyltransferase [Anaerolineae bacterium]